MTDEELQVTDVSDWKKGGSFFGTPMTLPSGKVARIKTPGIRAFMKSGRVPNSLMSIITSKLEPAKAGKPEEVDAEDMLREMLENPERLGDLLEMVDALTIECFAQPKVHPVPENDDNRDDSKLYVDEVDDDDKFFVFSVAVGGPKDLETFRDELDRNVEAVQSSLEMADKA